jgi:tyrosyl-tRNA synthetase
MQGYDAVAQQTDVQVGGTDQLFNIIVAGRKLQEAMGQKPLVGIITGILPGTDGVQRMSKSKGNIVPINTGADDMYGKVMSVPDAAMPLYFRLATRWTPDKIAEVESSLKSGAHPRDVKMSLAWEITSAFYGDAAADAAAENFRTIFQKGNIPDAVPAIKLSGEQKLVDFIVANNFAKSKNEARRLIEQGGVKVDGKPVEDVNAMVREGMLQVGKRSFTKVER